MDVGLRDRTTVSLCFHFLFSLPFTLFLPFLFYNMVSKHLWTWLLWFVKVHGCCVLVTSQPHLVDCLLVWLFLGCPISSPWMCGCGSRHFFCGSLLVYLCLVARVYCLYSGIRISLFHLSDILIPDMLWLLDLFGYKFNINPNLVSGYSNSKLRLHYPAFQTSPDLPFSADRFSAIFLPEKPFSAVGASSFS